MVDFSPVSPKESFNFPRKDKRKKKAQPKGREERKTLKNIRQYFPL